MLQFYKANVNELNNEEKTLFYNYSLKENDKIDAIKEFGIPQDILRAKLEKFFHNQLHPTSDKEITLHWYGEYNDDESPNVLSFCYLHKMNDSLFKITSVTSLDQGKGYGKALVEHILLTHGGQKVFLYAFVPKQFEGALAFYRSLNTHVLETTYEECTFPELPAEWLEEEKDKLGKEKWTCLWYPSRPAERLREIFNNTFLEEKEFEEMVDRKDDYKCISQPSADEALVVGNEGKISLWPVGTVIRFGVDESSFPNKSSLKKAVIALNKAVKKWNKIDFGVKFAFSKDKFRINFYMKYRTSLPGDYAEAFFPTRDISILYVHSALFIEDENYIEHILLHELGHVLGLRHEFAIKEEGDCVPFGVANPKSVMSYRFPPRIQTTDKDGIKELYQLKEGDIIKGFEVTFI